MRLDLSSRLITQSVDSLSVDLLDTALDVVVLGAADGAVVVWGDADPVVLGLLDSRGVASGHGFGGEGLAPTLVLDFLRHAQ